MIFNFTRWCVSESQQPPGVFSEESHICAAPSACVQQQSINAQRSLWHERHLCAADCEMRQAMHEEIPIERATNDAVPFLEELEALQREECRLNSQRSTQRSMQEDDHAWWRRALEHVVESARAELATPRMVSPGKTPRMATTTPRAKTPRVATTPRVKAQPLTCYEGQPESQEHPESEPQNRYRVEGQPELAAQTELTVVWTEIDNQMERLRRLEEQSSAIATAVQAQLQGGQVKEFKEPTGDLEPEHEPLQEEDVSPKNVHKDRPQFQEEYVSTKNVRKALQSSTVAETASAWLAEKAKAEAEALKPHTPRMAPKSLKLPQLDMNRPGENGGDRFGSARTLNSARTPRTPQGPDLDGVWLTQDGQPVALVKDFFAYLLSEDLSNTKTPIEHFGRGVYGISIDDEDFLGDAERAADGRLLLKWSDGETWVRHEMALVREILPTDAMAEDESESKDESDSSSDSSSSSSSGSSTTSCRTLDPQRLS